MRYWRIGERADMRLIAFDWDRTAENPPSSRDHDSMLSNLEVSRNLGPQLTVDGCPGDVAAG